MSLKISFEEHHTTEQESQSNHAEQGTVHILQIGGEEDTWKMFTKFEGCIQAPGGRHCDDKKTCKARKKSTIGWLTGPSMSVMCT